MLRREVIEAYYVCVKLNVTFCAQIERKLVLSYLRGEKSKTKKLTVKKVSIGLGRLPSQAG